MELGRGRDELLPNAEGAGTNYQVYGRKFLAQMRNTGGDRGLSPIIHRHSPQQLQRRSM